MWAWLSEWAQRLLVLVAEGVPAQAAELELSPPVSQPPALVLLQELPGAWALRAWDAEPVVCEWH